jgi:hypothetical protein
MERGIEMERGDRDREERRQGRDKGILYLKSLSQVSVSGLVRCEGEPVVTSQIPHLISHIPDLTSYIIGLALHRAESIIDIDQ